MVSKKVNSLEDLYSEFPRVKIEEGVFKYIFIKATNTATGESLLFLRGSGNHEYHKEIFQDFVSKFMNHLNVRGVTLSNSETKLKNIVEFNCPGGGRIEHSPKDKTITVYGYSMAYGPGDHTTAVQMLKETYPTYDVEKITVGTKEY